MVCYACWTGGVISADVFDGNFSLSELEYSPEDGRPAAEKPQGQGAVLEIAFSHLRSDMHLFRSSCC